MRQKIMVLISDGGGGHRSAGESLVEILSPKYDVQVVNAIDIVLKVDAILKLPRCFRFLTKKMVSGDTIYNWLLRNELGTLLKLIVACGRRYSLRRERQIEATFGRYLDGEPHLPHLIISTIPVINHGMILAAEQRKIPYLLVPTDLDLDLFLHGLNRLPQKSFERFKLAISYERPEIFDKIFQKTALSKEHVLYLGFPVRPACQVAYDHAEIAELKEQHGMDHGRHTVTLLMGAVGGNTIVGHAKEIASLNTAIDGKHLEANICVGKNRKSRARLIAWLLKEGGTLLCDKESMTSILSKAGVLLHIRGFTRDIISILACSDLIISKTGSCSVNEAIYLGKKLLLDNTIRATSRAMAWEEFNIWFIKRHGLGHAFSDSKELRTLIPYMIQTKTPFSPHLILPDFQINIAKVVEDLIH